MAAGKLLGLVEATGPVWTEVDLNDKLKVRHGIEAYTTLAFSDGDKALSLATVTYWYKGVKYTTAAPTVCDLDLTADRDNSSNTLTANTLYYFYFKDATGKLYWSDSSWSWTNDVFVATVFWNGSAGACQKETHGSTRDINWHQWAHDTVGCRIEGANGFGITTPSTGTPGAIDLATGTLHDEDLDITTGRQQVIRGWMLASSTKYTFVDYSTPYIGTAGQPQILNVSGPYSLANVTGSKYAVYWVYGSLDISRPIYVFVGTTEYTTIALARAEAPPALTGFGLNSEMKILYRWIFKGDGAFQESADYRASSPLPGGGSTIISAGNVIYAAGGGITATSVQTAIEELDTEKQVALTFGIADTNALRVDDATVSDNDYAKFTASGLEGRSYSDVLSDIGAAATAHNQAVANGGTGLTSIADGSVLAANAANTLTEITWHSSGTKVLTNTSGTISWEDAPTGSSATFTTAVLTVVGWDGSNQQTVSVTGATSSNNVIVFPPTDRTQMLAYMTAGISCITQATGTLTFECTTKPTIELTANIEII